MTDRLTLTARDRILFIGDSITDAGRDRTDPVSLGNGYVALLADVLRARVGDGLDVLNRGIGGDTAVMVRERWQRDAVDLEPTVVSLMVGINDTWRRYDSGRITGIEEYGDHLRAMLGSARDVIGARTVVLEPFLVPLTSGQQGWYADLGPRIAMARQVALEVGALIVPLDGVLAARSALVGPEVLVSDGVHPTPVGHRLIADAFLDGALPPAGTVW